MQRNGASSTQFRDKNSQAISSDSDSSCSGVDSDDNSDNEFNWKRSKVTKKNDANHYNTYCDQSKFAAASQIFQSKNESMRRPTAVDKFSVWSNVLQERSLAEDLSSVGVLQRDFLLDSTRDCESYDYTRKYESEEGRQMNPHLVHRRLGRKRSKKDQEGTQLELLNRNKRSFGVNEDDPEETVATAIATILREPKENLIGRVVNTLGTKKSLELLRMTEDIEEAGGIMTLDNSRRRTPGGVFLQLLRTDNNITKMDKTKIFELERVEQEKVHTELKRSRRRRRMQEMAKVKKESTESKPMLPSLPTLGEVLLNKDVSESVKMEARSDSEKEPGELDSSEDDSNDVPLT